MVKYDYSLDVGQSIETDKKLKKEQPEGCCPVPPPEEEKQEEPIEEEAVEDTEEPKTENSNTVPNSQNQDSVKEEEKKETVEIKPVSFEKAKLISDYTKETKEKKSEPDAPVSRKTEIPEATEEIPEINRQEEDEQDVNEFLEDSFKKETQEREEYNNNKIKQEPQKNSRKWIWALIAIIIIIGAGLYGYSQLKTPTSAATIPQNNTAEITPILETQNITPEPAVETKPANISVENALEHLTSSLKD